MINVLNWVFGIIFLLSGLGNIFSSNIFSGICYLLIATLCLPPVRKGIEAKTNITITKGKKTVLIILCVILGAAYSKENLTESTNPIPSETEQAIESNKEEVIPSATYSIGDKVKVGLTEYTVNGIRWQKRIGNEYYGQDANARFLLLNVVVKNNDNNAQMVNEFQLADENGATYDPDNGAVMYIGDKSFLFENLNPGVSKSGIVVFDVPSDHKYKLKVFGGFMGADSEQISLN